MKLFVQHLLLKTCWGLWEKMANCSLEPMLQLITLSAALQVRFKLICKIPNIRSLLKSHLAKFTFASKITKNPCKGEVVCLFNKVDFF